MTKRVAAHLVLVFLLVVAFQPAAMATIVTDGVEDFSGGLTDWTVTDAIGSVVTDSGGNDFALLEEDFYLIGSLSQDITLESFHTVLEFDYAVGLLDPQKDPGGIIDGFQVSLFNGTDEVILFNADIDTFDSTVLTDPNFLNVSIDLSAFDLSAFWGSTTTLYFDIIDADYWVNSALALDNVFIYPGGEAPVPEPATLLLLGGGLLGAIAYRKRRASTR